MTPGDLITPAQTPGTPLQPAIPSSAKPIEHFRVGALQSSVPPTMTQIAIRKLLMEKPQSEGHFIAKVTNATVTTLAEIEALYNAIVCTGIFNGQDAEKIEKLAKTLDIQQKKIRWPSAERSGDIKAIQTGRLALKELRELASTLNRIQPIEDKLQECFDSISDQVYTPEFVGDSLLAAPYIALGIDALKSLNQNASIGMEGTAHMEVAEEKYADAKTGVAEALDDWAESTLEGIRTQKNELLSLYQNTQGDASKEIVQLLGSLLLHERAVIRTLLQKATELKDTKDLQGINRQLTQAAGHLNEEARNLAAALKENQIPLDKTLPYGSPAWRMLAEKHLLKPEVIKEKKWNPLAKRFLYGVFQGVQVYNQASQMNQRVWQAINASSTAAEAKAKEESSPGWLSWVRGKIGTIGTTAALQNDLPAQQKAYATAQVAQGSQRLESSVNQLNQTLIEMRLIKDETLKPLIDEISLLKRELLKTSARAPKDTCTLLEFAHWKQEVDDQCYAIERIEQRIGVLMEGVRELLSPDDAELEKFGKKHANNIRLKRLVEGLQLEGVKVPDSKGIKSDAVSNYLHAYAPDVFDAWQSLGRLHETYQGALPFLKNPEAKQHLEVIVYGIEKAFAQAADSQELFEQLVTPDVIDWLKSIAKANDFLMVRSTGAEDSRKSANAGGNLSRNYVKPTRAEFCKAAGEVVASYFSTASLQNRIVAGDNPFEGELKLAVTAQELIGEPVGGETTDPSQIPISLVLFTSEPLYVGNEKFRTMRISATHGHGEGVVGSVQGVASDTTLLLVSEAHPDRLYVMYDNNKKQARLAPVSRNKIELGVVPNPEAISSRPVLDSTLLSRLYILGVVTEHFFGDNATDMEIVIKGETIYPVQARPVIRQPANPSFIDRKKLGAADPSTVIDTFRSEVLVPGKCNVIYINSIEELDMQPSLLQAQEAYKKEIHKAVVVSEPESANSHPIVNFSGLSVTCILANMDKVRKIMEKTSGDQTLVIDSQTGDGFLVKGDGKTYVSQGYAVHPMNLPLTVTQGDVGKPSSPKEAPQDVKDLLISIRSAATNEAALKAFEELKQHPTLAAAKQRKQELEAKLQDHKFVPSPVTKALTALDEIDKAMEEIMEETKAAITNAAPTERLKPLIRVKVLESVLVGRTPSAGTIGQYSLMDVDFIYKDAMALVDYQKKFDHPVHFSGIYLAGDKALDPSSTQQWRTFLESLEQHVQSGAIPKHEVKRLHDMMHALEDTGVLPLWFTFFFSGIEAPNMLALLKTNLDTFPLESKAVFENTLSIANKIQSFRSGMGVITRPSTFEQGVSRLNDLIDEMKGKKFYNELKSSPLVVRLMILNTMLNGIDLYDTAIKEMRMSSAWTQEEKVPLFKMMLRKYYDFLQNSVSFLSEDLNFPKFTPKALLRYCDYLGAWVDYLPDHGVEQFIPTGYNAEQIVMSRCEAEWLRIIKTLEDTFTLIHKNLLAVTTNMISQVIDPDLINRSALPQNLKNAIADITPKNLGRNLFITSFEVTEEAVIVKYNVPLRDHSADLMLRYDAVSGAITIEGKFMGGEISNRWHIISFMANVLDEIGILPLNNHPSTKSNSVRIEWKANDRDTLKRVLKEFEAMVDFSLNFGQDSLENLLGRYSFDDNQALVLFRRALSDETEWIRNLGVYLIPKLNKYTETIAAAEKEAFDTDENVSIRSLKIFKTLASHGIELERAAAVLAKKIEDPNCKVRSILPLVKQLLKKGTAFKEVNVVAVRGSTVEDATVRIESFDLFIDLVKQGEGLKEALTAANGVIEGDEGNLYVIVKVLELYAELVKREIGLEGGLVAAARGVIEGDSYVIQDLRLKALKLYKELVKRGIGFEKGGLEKGLAAAIDVQTMNNEIEATSLEIYSELVKHGIELTVALQKAEKYVVKDSILLKEKAIDLYSELVKQGEGINAALAIAPQGMTHWYSQIKIATMKLYKELLIRGQGLDGAWKAAKSGISSYYANEYMIALEIYQELVIKGVAIEEAAVAAAKCASKGNVDVKSAAFKVFSAVVEKEIELKETDIAATVKQFEEAREYIQTGLYMLIEQMITEQRDNAFVKRLEATLPYYYQFLLWWTRMTQARK